MMSTSSSNWWKQICRIMAVIFCIMNGIYFVWFFCVYISDNEKLQNVTQVTEEDLLWNRKENMKPPKYPIDIIITWAGTVYSNNDNRNRYNGELKYCLRSIYQNIPWFNHIFIVTNPKMKQKIMNNESFMDINQIKLKQNKISIVSHNQIFKKLENAIDCESSGAIESNLHHIHNLSDHYIYFNDDFFIGRPISHKFFFFYDKYNNPHRLIPRIPYIRYKYLLMAGFVDTLPCLSSDDIYLGLTAKDIPFNNNKSMTWHGGEHMPYPYYKEDWIKFEKDYPKFLDFIESKKNRFKNCHNTYISLERHFYRKWLLDDDDIKMNKIYIKNYDFWLVLALKYMGLWGYRSYYNYFIFGEIVKDLDKFKYIFSKLKQKKPLTFCINDDYPKDDPTKNQQLFRNFMDSYFQIKSPIEK